MNGWKSKFNRLWHKRTADEIERSHPLYEPLIGELLRQAFEPQSSTTLLRKGEVRDWLNSLLDD